MLNHYPIWKYLILIFVLLISIIYTIPNFYGEYPAIQITGLKENIINKKTLNLVASFLKKEKIISKEIILKNGKIFICFNNSDTQMHAYDVLTVGLGNKYIVTLNLIPATPNWLRKLNSKPIKLGLDLRGGVHFLMEIDMDKILSKIQEKTINRLVNDLQKKSIKYSNICKLDNYSIRIIFLNKNSFLKAKSHITKHYDELNITNDSNNILKISITDKKIREVKNNVISQNINIIRNRINQLGILEALIHYQGSDRIAVEMPGIQDIARAKNILGATATLEFRLINNNIDQFAIINNNIPNDSEIKYTKYGDPVVLYKNVVLTGDHITDAKFNFDEIGNPQVTIDLDSIGGSIMYKFTHDNQDKWMATLFVEYEDIGHKYDNGRIILTKSEKIINIAKISGVFGNKFRITGINDLPEVRQLSLLLRAGTLLAPLKIVEERIIGPTLGLKNIKKGIQASLAGLFTSIIFMVLYYRKFGFIASSALLANLILVIGIMSLLPGMTLTMPGIAGIILTLAIAVDANVLINERIKEELKNGRSIQQAIHRGYKGALSSILDANLTTVITITILYIVGTGVIKSFAISTAIGIITSMFSSIIGTRAIVNLLYGGKNIKKLSI
ncbi:Protein translocase subunit SecD [Candidatus Arsenophonus lipoptenae]|uniref:Protein translocase subunit SecD n=1 Tax=Candidatus Arsenophonus lipoptenae TaxID=634113 RepID=A0A0X9W2T3_9GAMM|nr:protein translocase subunit SecD [Candidatus Arsenophonus lipoptenae]AMA64819.1 Protein translocase subunit SecD [Candidatus Arsenophonus lipoptenae]